MSIKKIGLVALLIIMCSASASKAQSINVWGAEATVGVSHGEFSYPILSTPSTTEWYTVHEDNEFSSNIIYWNQSVTGTSAASSNPVPSPIGSPSQANGVAIFDTAYLGQLGLLNGGGGYAASIISPRIDLTGFAGLPITAKFMQCLEVVGMIVLFVYQQMMVLLGFRQQPIAPLLFHMMQLIG